MSLCGWEGRVFAVCSATPPLRHGRKGGGDKPCQDVPAGTAWHDVAEDGLRKVAEWRRGGVTNWQVSRWQGNAARPTYPSPENPRKNYGPPFLPFLGSSDESIISNAINGGPGQVQRFDSAAPSVWQR